MVVQVFNPALGRQRRQISELEARLTYTVSSRTFTAVSERVRKQGWEGLSMLETSFET